MKRLSTFHSIMASLGSSKDAIVRIFNTLGIKDYLFVGGLSTIYHGYARTTHDIDIIVSTDTFDKIFENETLIRENGFEFGTEGQLHFEDGTDVEFLIEGAPFVKDPTRSVPMLKDLERDEDVNFPNLETFFRSKAQRGNIKDIADIVEVLKYKKLSETEQIQILEKMSRDDRSYRNFKRALEVLKEEI